MLLDMIANTPEGLSAFGKCDHIFATERSLKPDDDEMKRVTDHIDQLCKDQGYSQVSRVMHGYESRVIKGKPGQVWKLIVEVMR